MNKLTFNQLNVKALSNHLIRILERQGRIIRKVDRTRQETEKALQARTRAFAKETIRYQRLPRDMRLATEVLKSVELARRTLEADNIRLLKALKQLTVDRE